MKAEPLPESDEARHARLVAGADTDADGEVSDAELTALVHEYVEKQVQARFAKLDRNRDGRVTRAEVPNMAAARFARFDANDDGAFTARELGLVLLAQATERCRSILVRLDTDGDGKVSLADATRPERLTKNEAKRTGER